jgi:IclR family transcriptional regulator, acetate operon repressor
MKDADTQSHSAISRGIDLLEWIVTQDRPVTSAEAAVALGLTRPTGHRVAQQLEEAGLLQREPNGKRFTAANRLANLAIKTLAHAAIGSSRHAVLQTLSEEINETCNCVVLDGNALVYFDRVEANWPMRIHLPVGSRVPLHATASGKLFLAMLPKQQQQERLDSIGFESYTELTVTNRKSLQTELDTIREKQIGVDRGEYLEGLISLAVPVYDNQNRICFAIAVHAPTVRRTLEELYQYVPTMQIAANRLSTIEDNRTQLTNG